MGRFVAQKRVSRIEWDFAGVPHREPGEDAKEQHVHGADVQGTLREPDEDAAADFLVAMDEVFVDARKRALESDDDDAEPGESLKAFHLRQYGQVIDALDGLGVPRGLLDQLPYRVLLEFAAHVAEEMRGEGASAS